MGRATRAMTQQHARPSPVLPTNLTRTMTPQTDAKPAAQHWPVVFVRSVPTQQHAHSVEILHFTWSMIIRLILWLFVPDMTKTVTMPVVVFIVIQIAMWGVTNGLTIINANVGPNMEILCTAASVPNRSAFVIPTTNIAMLILVIV